MLTKSDYDALVKSDGAAYADMVAAMEGGVQSDPIQQTAAKNSLLNSVTGTIGKGFDTFLDALALGAANKVVGTQYPTGQLSPEQLAAIAKANTQQAANTQAFNWKPWAIGGGIAFGAIILLAVIVPRSAK